MIQTTAMIPLIAPFRTALTLRGRAMKLRVAPTICIVLMMNRLLNIASLMVLSIRMITTTDTTTATTSKIILILRIRLFRFPTNEVVVLNITHRDILQQLLLDFLKRIRYGIFLADMEIETGRKRVILQYAHPIFVAIFQVFLLRDIFCYVSITLGIRLRGNKIHQRGTVLRRHIFADIDPHLHILLENIVRVC